MKFRSLFIILALVIWQPIFKIAARDDSKIIQHGFVKLLVEGYRFVNSQNKEEKQEAVGAALQTVVDLFSLIRSPLRRTPPEVFMQQCLNEEFLNELCTYKFEDLAIFTN